MSYEPAHLDLFSGIGGFALAAGWAGFRTVGFSEVDPYCCAVLRKHWPGVKQYGDIRTADFSAIGSVDLLTGGFPCQPFSCAGKRRGASDDRHLWPAMLRVITSVRPAWVLGENVPGIIGMEFERVIAGLEAESFRVEPLVIPACAVGARHRRERVWIVANAKRQRLEEQRQQPARHKLQAIERSCENWPRIWATEPDVGRVADGIPKRMDRIRALGNAIVPQVAFEILKNIRALI